MATAVYGTGRYGKDTYGGIQLRPVIEVDGTAVPLGNVLAETRITHGTPDWSTSPSPNSLSLSLVDPSPELLALVDVGSEIRVTFAGVTRFYGYVTDTALYWEALPRLDVTAVGPLEHLGWARIYLNRPAETEAVRLQAIMGIVYGNVGEPGVDYPAWSVPGTGTDQLIPVDYGDLATLQATVALGAVSDILQSTGTRLTENRDGTMTWRDRQTRIDAVPYVISADRLVVDGTTHRTTSSDVVNGVHVSYGTPPVKVSHLVSGGFGHGLNRYVELRTQLATEAAAEAYAERTAVARSVPRTMLPTAVLPVTVTPWEIAAPLLECEVGFYVQIPDWPYPHYFGEVSGFVEGWTERVRTEFGAIVLWEVAYGLSHPALSRPVTEPGREAVWAGSR